MSRSTHMSLERGVLFFEDGTEVSNVSEELIKAAPEMLIALRGCLQGLLAAYPHADRIRDILQPHIDKARTVLTMATGGTDEA